MTRQEYLELRIDVLEESLSELIRFELSTLAPYASDRYAKLDAIISTARDRCETLDSDINQNGFTD